MGNLKYLKCNIKDIREKKFITQEQLSNATGMTIAQISRYENNKIYANALNLWAIAEALACEVGELYSK